MDNIENVVVNFQKTLLIILKKIEKLESLEKMSRSSKAFNEEGLYTKEIKQPTHGAATPAKMPRPEPSAMHNVSINKGANLQKSGDEIPESVSSKNATDVKESSISKRSTFSGIFSKIFKKVSSKSNYLILAVALAVLGIAVVEIYFSLFP